MRSFVSSALACGRVHMKLINYRLNINSWVVDLQLHVFLYPSPFPDTVYFHNDFLMVIADDSSDNLLNTGLKIMEIKMAYLKVAKLFCENKWIKIIVWPQNKSLTSFKSYFRIKITHANFTRVLGGILECIFEAERLTETFTYWGQILRSIKDQLKLISIKYWNWMTRLKYTCGRSPRTQTGRSIGRVGTKIWPTWIFMKFYH